jgi:hypothetical protein
MEWKISSLAASAPRWLSPGHDVVGVSLPESDRHRDVTYSEAPVAGEEHEVQHGGLYLTACTSHDVLEEHRFHLGLVEHALVALRRQRDVQVEHLRP